MYMAQGNNTDSFVGKQEEWNQSDDGNKLNGKVNILQSNMKTFKFDKKSNYKSSFNLRINQKLKELTIQFSIYSSNKNKSAYNNWNIRTPQDFDKFSYDPSTANVLYINPYKIGTKMPQHT